MTPSDHSSVKRFHERGPAADPPSTLDAREMRELCLNLGADDVGFIEIDRAGLGRERDDILGIFRKPSL